MSISSTSDIVRKKDFTETSNTYQHIVKSSNFKSEVDTLFHVELIQLLTEVIVSGNLDNIKYIHENKHVLFSTYHLKSIFRSNVSEETKREIITYILKEVSTNNSNYYTYFHLLSDHEITMLIEWNLFKDVDGSFCLYCLNRKQNHRLIQFVKVVWKTIDVKYRHILRTIRDRMIQHNPVVSLQINELLISTEIPTEKYPSMKDLITFLETHGMENELDQLKDWMSVCTHKERD
jgi:hypothetical protein